MVACRDFPKTLIPVGHFAILPLMKPGKSNKQNIINALIKELEKGTERGDVVAKYCKKLQKSARTIDSYWKIANEQHSALQQKAKEAANKVYVETIAEAAIETAMSEIEAKKLTTDIARGNLADYLIVKKVEHSPRIEISLSEYIDRLNQEIEFEDEFAAVAGYNGKEKKVHNSMQAGRRRNVIRLQLELKRNPAATRIINGPTEWIETAELDLVKLAADKEKGKIKSFAHTQYGVKVEMYGADSAITNILKIHGSFAPEKVTVTNGRKKFKFAPRSRGNSA